MTALAKIPFGSIFHKRAGLAALKQGAEKGLSAHSRAELMPQITSQN